MYAQRDVIAHGMTVSTLMLENYDEKPTQKHDHVEKINYMLFSYRNYEY